MKTFGDRLKMLRNDKNMTQKELGKKLNVTNVGVAKWESNDRFPDSDTLIKIADFFDVTLDYLLCRSDSIDNDIQTREVKKDKSSKDILQQISESIAVGIEDADWLLQLIIHFNNTYECYNDREIILNYSNSIVKGKLISVNRYLEELKNNMKDSIISQMTEQLRTDTFTDFQDKNPRKTGYIHLKDTTIISNEESIEVGLWRGQIKNAIGFSIK